MMGKRTDDDGFVKIAVLDSPVEAALLESMLQARRVTYMMVDYTSSAYDGLFQLSRGWGHIEAPVADKDQVLAAIDEVRTQQDGAGTARDA